MGQIRTSTRLWNNRPLRESEKQKEKKIALKEKRMIAEMRNGSNTSNNTK